MKKLTLAIAALCMVAGMAMAQNQSTAKSSKGGNHQQITADQMITRKDNEIQKAVSNLSDKQIKQIHKLNKQSVTEMEKERANMPQPPKNGDMQNCPPKGENCVPQGGNNEMKTKMKAQREAYNSSLKEILDADQYAQYTTYLNNRKQNLKQNCKGKENCKGKAGCAKCNEHKSGSENQNNANNK